MRWLDGITISIDMSLSKLCKLVKDREAWPVGVHSITKSQTRLINRAMSREQDSGSALTPQPSYPTIIIISYPIQYPTLSSGIRLEKEEWKREQGMRSPELRITVEDPPEIPVVGYLRRKENGSLIIHSCDSFLQGVFLQKDGRPGHQPPWVAQLVSKVAHWINCLLRL